MPRLLVIFLLLLVSVKSVSADVVDEVKEYNKRSLPPVGSALDVNGVNITVPPNPTTGASYTGGKEELIYNFSHAELVKPDPLDPKTFFQKRLDFFKDLFGIGA